MLRFALNQPCPASIRYPKANVERIERLMTDVELGKAEVIDWGEDGAFVAFGSLMPACVAAASRLRDEGLQIGVINARFAKPLDRETILKAVEQLPFVITVEEGTLEGGFGSAVLEAASTAGLDTRNIVRLGIPDRFIEHAERNELLASLGLDVAGLCRAARRALGKGHEEQEVAGVW